MEGNVRIDPIVSAILDLLATGEKCLCELKDAIGIPRTWELYDLRVLEDLEAVKSRTANGYRYYSLTAGGLRNCLRRPMASAGPENVPVRRPVRYDSALEYTRRRMPRISEYEAALRRGC